MKRFLFLLCGQLAFAALAAEPSNSPKTTITDDPLTEANIAKSVAKVLERYHYSQLKLDDELSEKFLDRYIETLDGQHLHFLASDVEEFSTYRTKLDDLTLRAGDTSPSHRIFDRLMERLEQRKAYVDELLKNEKFEFKGKDKLVINRKDQPRPKNLEEAKQLWKQVLRYEYLQEKLGIKDKEAKAKAEKEKKPLKEGEWKEGYKVDGELKFDSKTPKENKSKGKTAEKSKTDSKKPALKQHDQIVETLTNRYNRLLKNFRDLSPDEVLEYYLTALAHVYDPHSDYMGRAQMENFAISMKLSLFGIGAVLTMDDQGYCKIHELKDGPAKKSKQIKEGDRIVAVAQGEKEPIDCVGMKLTKVVEMIRGAKGTEVRLTVMPVDSGDPSDRKVVTLIRDEIKLEDQEAKAKVIDMPTEDGKVARVGVIDLPSFYEDMEGKGPNRKSTSADIARLLKKLNEEKISGLILDLRRNGGGALSEAIKLTGLFIKKGPVVQTKDFSGKIDVKSDTDSSVLYDGPMIVLTSRFSASASEILAGALQDYGRALIVGDSSTHGKGTVQQLLQLENILHDSHLEYVYDPGALKFTIQKFYRAGGSSTQLKGVVPDLVLPSVNNFAEIGEKSLDNPLEWDEVSSAKFEKLNRVEPYLVELKKHSDSRLQANKDFEYIRQDIERFKKKLADKSVSLNENEWTKEKDEAKAIDEARKKERKARKPSDEKVYEVLLKNVDQPLKLASKEKEKNDNEVSAETSKTEGDEEDKTPGPDATLDETKHILIDYINLSSKEHPAVTLK